MRAIGFVSLSCVVATGILLGACQPSPEAEVRPRLITPKATPSPRPSGSSTVALPTGLPAQRQDGNADVLHVRTVQSDDGSWTFHVTILHPDSGCEDYADGWDVFTPEGTVLKPDPSSPFSRLLLHPRENEQPFTRSQSGIVVPPGVTQVRVRAHDLVDGFGGKEVQIDLTASSGDSYEVERN
jgi:hypothetical protein